MASSMACSMALIWSLNELNLVQQQLEFEGKRVDRNGDPKRALGVALHLTSTPRHPGGLGNAPLGNSASSDRSTSASSSGVEKVLRSSRDVLMNTSEKHCGYSGKMRSKMPNTRCLRLETWSTKAKRVRGERLKSKHGLRRHGRWLRLVHPHQISQDVRILSVCFAFADV